MPEAQLDVLGIGNAMVDVLSHAEDTFLVEHHIEKGAMTLVDAERSAAIYDAMGPGVEISGGSAANTIVGTASLGARAGYIGKVNSDQLGEVFMHDIRAAGVAFDTKPASDHPTGRCLILVTPDAQRSMNTFLGASSTLGPNDIDEEKIKNAAVTYMEGYLFDPPPAREAFYKAAAIAHKAGREVSLTLSDSFCVDRYRKEFQHLVENEVDILFANELEIKSLYETESFDEALQIVRQKCKVAALTRSQKGSVIVAGDEVHVIDAEPVDKVVDTTGAGDLYASGFLYGYTKKMGHAVSGRLGGIAAAEIISHFGPRPETSLRELALAKGIAL